MHKKGWRLGVLVVGLALVEAVIGLALIVRADVVAAWVRSRRRSDDPGSYLSVYQQPVAYRIVGTLLVIFAGFQLIAQR